MRAGRAFDADASDIDCRGPRHFREMVGDTGERVGVDVTGFGGVYPAPMGHIDRTVAVAVQNDDRARAATSGCGKIVAAAESLTVDVEPPRRRGPQHPCKRAAPHIRPASIS